MTSGDARPNASNDDDDSTFTRQELGQLVKTLRQVLWKRPAARRQLQDAGINVIPANFYSDVPTLAEIESASELRGGVTEWFNTGMFNTEKMVDHLALIGRYASEFDPPLDADQADDTVFHWRNPAFSFSDAMAYYCMLRLMQPLHVIEIGCGYSTLVANMALTRNGRGSMTLVEPYVKPFLRKLPTVRAIIERPVQAIPIEELVELVESAEVLFIDSTHTVKVGSDCLSIYLRLLPRIRRRITVHAHDIYLPYALPKAYAMDKHIYWTEQYLLYAYLLDNPRATCLFSSQYLYRTGRNPLDAFMLNRYPSGGASLWFELDGLAQNESAP